MSLIEAFVKNPVKIAVGVLLVLLFGVIALTRMPMQLTPEVETPTLTIETNWPGASPREVEREIIQEQEEQLKSVEGINKMTSESRDSQGRIILEFGVGTDMSQALLKVNTRLQQVREYPEEADEPVITTSNSSDNPIAWFILSPRVPEREEIEAFLAKHSDLKDALTPALRANSLGLRWRRLTQAAAKHPELQELMPPKTDLTTYRKFAEDVIEARFERVKGVSNSNVLGGREEELQVLVDPERLAARALTIADIRVALRARNRDTSGGDLWEGKRRYVVRTLGQFRSPEDVSEVIVANREGGPVYLRDVAEVKLGYKKPDGVVRHFGTTSLAVNCLRDNGANVIEVMKGLNGALEELNAGVLKREGLMLEQVYDETEYIYSAVGLVQSNIVVGGLLTIAALLLFLRSGRSTLIIALAIPTSLIGTFLVLDVLNRSLNVISLAGLAFAVGMLVDNAVVVLENIYRHLQLGRSPSEAAVRGAKEVWGAVVASTLTTLAVFVPVLFVEEEAGQLFRDIALAISAAVALSLLVSVTVIPTAAARLLRKDSGDGGGILGTLLSPLDGIAGLFVRAVVGLNRWLQGGVIRRLVTIIVFVGASIGLSWITMPKVEYLPNGNRNLVFGILLPPPGYNLEKLLEMGQKIERDLEPWWDVDPGTPEAEKLDAIVGDFFYVARGRQVFLGLRANDPLKAGKLVPIIQRVCSTIPGTFGVAKQSSLFSRGLTAGRTVDIEITGPDLQRLVALGGRTFGAVRQVLPTAQALPKPSLDLSSPELHLDLRREKAADLGVSAVDLGYTVNALIDGAYATDYFVGGDKIDLSIVGRPEFARRLQSVEDLPIATPGGRLVPLKAVARVSLGAGPEQINHRERQRTITIEVSPPEDIPLELAIDKIRNEVVAPMLADGSLDGGYSVNYSGTADKLNATWRALRLNIILALLITYLLMAALFESWLYPFVVILSVPLGAVGGFGGLWLLNRFLVQQLDTLTMLGFVILIGTVVNNAILIVHQSLNGMTDEGLEPRAAVLESVRTRIRPIFMTTSTTVLGLMPLVLFPGAGSELYRGLGSVVLGGLVVSTLFTLILVPTLFSLVMDIFGTPAEAPDIGEGAVPSALKAPTEPRNEAPIQANNQADNLANNLANNQADKPAPVIPPGDPSAPAAVEASAASAVSSSDVTAERVTETEAPTESTDGKDKKDGKDGESES